KTFGLKRSYCGQTPGEQVGQNGVSRKDFSVSFGFFRFLSFSFRSLLFLFLTFASRANAKCDRCRRFEIKTIAIKASAQWFD
ncbi:MAG: hypothetical protein O2949_11975, partial [Proteobacteria bacterium]|nr:hypothetical protein [Pseudomonadota bacterium]